MRREGPKFEAEGREREGALGSSGGDSEPLEDLGERCKLPQRGLGHSPDLKYILDPL